jgi:pimeloyl-ACP methyl ester carboxylesterase
MTGVIELRNQLSARSEYSDESIAEHVRLVSGSEEDLKQARLIILIHGYQNSQAAAEAKFADFRATLAAAIWPKPLSRLGTIWEFHWPGDHSAQLVSILTFTVRINEAKESGRLLADYLAGLHAAKEVHLIGHSLGCRVALETAHEVREMAGDYHGPAIRSLILFAAAVPIPLCMPSRRYGSGPADSTETVLYSARDKVLQWAFRPGEYPLGERGQAVGRYGNPVARPWSDRVRTGLGHGKYWGSPRVAQVAGWVLGDRTSRKLPEQIETDSDPALDSHSLPRRAIKRWGLPRRSM